MSYQTERTSLSRHTITDENILPDRSLDREVDKIAANEILNDLHDPEFRKSLYENSIRLDADAQIEMVKSIQAGTKLNKVMGDSLFSAENGMRLVVTTNHQSERAKQDLATLMHASEGFFHFVTRRYILLHGIPDIPQNWEDLTSTARVAGILAIYTFDASLDIRFVTYAYKVIYNNLTRHWNEKIDEYSRSDSTTKRVRMIKAYIQKFKDDHHGKSVSVSQIASALSMDYDTVRDIVPTLFPPVRLDRTLNLTHDSDTTFGELIPNPNSELDNAILEQNKNLDLQMIRNIFKAWNTKIQTIQIDEQKIYAQRRMYALWRSFRGETYVDIGAKLGVTKQRIESMLKIARIEFQDVALSLEIDLEWPKIAEPLKLPGNGKTVYKRSELYEL